MWWIATPSIQFRFPIRIESYYRVISYDLARLRNQLGRSHPYFIKLLGGLYLLKYIPSGEEGQERYNQICNYLRTT